MAKHKSTARGSLLKGVLERIQKESFEVIADAIEKTMKGESGIYALYKKDRLYYVGLARNLKGRVKKHTRDRHAKKWDNFSIYTIKQAKYLGDVETIILRIGKPQGNKQSGRIRNIRALQKILDKEVKKKARDAKKEVREAKKKVRESKLKVRKLKKFSANMRKPKKKKTRRAPRKSTRRRATKRKVRRRK